MDSNKVEAFMYWFASKYEAEQLDDNFWAFNLEVDQKKVITFIYFWEDYWTVACPILQLDKKSKSNLFSIMEQHADRSPVGLTLIGDMLSIVDCSQELNAAEADVWINSFAAHAAELLD